MHHSSLVGVTVSVLSNPRNGMCITCISTRSEAWQEKEKKMKTEKIMQYILSRYARKNDKFFL